MKALIAAGALLLLTLLITSCTWHSEEELYGLELCDTTSITWEEPIQEILAMNCVECHNETEAYNGVRHDEYEYELIVVEDGRLGSVINHEPGFPAMPYQRDQLPECELLLLNLWIERGAPEN